MLVPPLLVSTGHLPRVPKNRGPKGRLFGPPRRSVGGRARFLVRCAHPGKAHEGATRKDSGHGSFPFGCVSARIVGESVALQRATRQRERLLDRVSIGAGCLRLPSRAAWLCRTMRVSFGEECGKGGPASYDVRSRSRRPKQSGSWPMKRSTIVLSHPEEESVEKAQEKSLRAKRGDLHVGYPPAW